MLLFHASAVSFPDDMAIFHAARSKPIAGAPRSIALQQMSFTSHALSLFRPSKTNGADGLVRAASAWPGDAGDGDG